MVRSALLVTMALLCAGAHGRADEIILTNGRKISCEVVEVTDEWVYIELKRGEMRIARDRVSEIRRESPAVYLKREAEKSARSGSAQDVAEAYEAAYAAAVADNPWVEESTAAPELEKKYVAALIRYAEELVRQFRFRDARVTLDKLGKVKPGHALIKRLDAVIEREEKLTEKLFQHAAGLTEAGDHERALAYLEAWRVRRPVGDDGAGRTMGEAYLAAGAAAAEAGRLRRALDHYRAAAAFGRYASRQLYLLQPIAVLESLREGDVECARFLLDGITTTYPHPATPVFLQAVVSHVSGEVAQAVSKYSEAARLAAAKAASRPGVAYDVAKKYATATLRAAIARPPQEGVKRWRSIFLGPLERSDDGRHFVVFAPAKAQAEKIAASADRIYETIARDLLGRIPNASKAEIVVHANRQAYVAADPEPPGSPVRGVTVPRQKTGGLCYDTLDEHGKPLVRVETYPVADWTKSTLPHEIVHVVQRRGLAVFRQGKWLDEGLAMLYESRASQQNRLALWRTLAKARIPLPELLALRSIPPARATLFYAESHAFAAFLRSLGDEQDWRDFLREYTRQDFPNAIRSVYEIESVEVLERMWIEKGTRLR